jgi:HEAT repeat protein
MRPRDPEFIAALNGYEAPSLALRSMTLDVVAGWFNRGTALKLLVTADATGAVADVLTLFFEQTEKLELWETALTIEYGADGSAVPRLIDALEDENLDRRHTAARALGWLWPKSSRAAKALIRTLLDKSQPQPVREEAAESLAYSDYQAAVPALISVLDEPDVRIRFWAVFALAASDVRKTHVP